MWQDLGQMLHAVRDGRLVELGRQAFKLVRNTTAAGQDLSGVLGAELLSLRGVLTRLREELVPPRFRATLHRHAAAQEASLVQGMLSPEALSEMRKEPTAAR